MESNERLQRNVQDAIKFDPALHAAEIGVIVHGGVITLTGTVDTYLKKVAAENAAKKVRGVRAVVEKIEVVPGKHALRTDEEIAQAVLHAFEWSWNIPDDKIIAKVEDGWIWLDGTVSRAFQREAAAGVAAGVPGIKGITNGILLKAEVKDKLEKDTIVAALKRNWAIDPVNIQVKVEHNKVILSGTVDSLYERSEAARIAWDAPGVAGVENKLVVEFQDDIY